MAEDFSSFQVTYTDFSSPLGRWWIAVGPRGVLRVRSEGDEAEFCWELAPAGADTVRYDPHGLAGLVARFVRYFAGQRTEFDMPVDLSRVRPFQRTVLEAVRTVPWGEVRSYRDIAGAIGQPAAARAVGSAVATNPVSLIIPCHRIIRSDGTPGEYARRTIGRRGAERKLFLLALEGVTFGSKHVSAG